MSFWNYSSTSIAISPSFLHPHSLVPPFSAACNTHFIVIAFVYVLYWLLSFSWLIISDFLVQLVSQLNLITFQNWFGLLEYLNRFRNLCENECYSNVVEKTD